MPASRPLPRKNALPRVHARGIAFWVLLLALLLRALIPVGYMPQFGAAGAGAPPLPLSFCHGHSGPSADFAQWLAAQPGAAQNPDSQEPPAPSQAWSACPFAAALAQAALPAPAPHDAWRPPAAARQAAWARAGAAPAAALFLPLGARAPPLLFS